MKTSNRTRIHGWLAVAASVCAIAILFSLWGYAQAPQSGPRATATTPRQNSSLQVEVIGVTRFGFEPAKISRKVGPFILALENRSRAELNVRLGTPTTVATPVGSVLATVLQSVPLLHSRPDQSNLLDLAPGDYLLIEDNHPQWQCKITITP